MFKKNLKLLFLLFFLVGGFYLFEHKYKKPVTLDDQLITNINELIEFQIDNSRYINDGDWKLKGGQFKISQEKVKMLLQKLSELSILSKFKNKNVQDYFTHFKKSLTLKFKNGKSREFIFGDFSPFSKAFYLKEENNLDEVFMIKDQSYFSGTYQDDLDLNLKKHQVWRQFLSSHLQVLQETSLAKQLDLNLSNFEIVTFQNHMNREFKINLKEQSMTVPPYKGVGMKKPLKVLKEHLASMVVIRPVMNKNIVLSESRAEISMSSGDQTYTLKYYLSLNDKFGHFVKDNQSRVFEIDHNELGLFKLNAQSFWDKKIFYNVDFSKLSQFEFQIESSKGKYDFFVEDINKFKVLAKNEKIAFISDAHMNFLFHLLLNLATFEQAEYILQKTDMTNDFDLKVRLFGKELAIKIERDFIIVYDTKLKLVYYYQYQKKQIELDFFNNLFQLKGEK